MTIYFDMDGTIADLYNVKGWAKYIEERDPYPYVVAKPMLRLAALARQLNTLQAAGYRLGVISWLAKDSTPSYDHAVTAAKLGWLKQHLPSVEWDEIQIVAYGTPKSSVAQDSGLLFDDCMGNRAEWNVAGKGQAANVYKILEILKNLAVN